MRANRSAASVALCDPAPSGPGHPAKIYIDQTGKLQKNSLAKLGDAELVGQVEFDSRWPKGYGSMTVVRFPGR